jgi:hypothetical protein
VLQLDRRRDSASFPVIDALCDAILILDPEQPGKSNVASGCFNESLGFACGHRSMLNTMCNKSQTSFWSAAATRNDILNDVLIFL